MAKIKTEKDGVVDMKALDKLVDKEFYEEAPQGTTIRLEGPDKYTGVDTALKEPLVDSIRSVYLVKKGVNWHLMTVYIENDKVVKVDESNGNTKQGILDRAFKFLHRDSQARRG